MPELQRLPSEHSRSRWPATARCRNLAWTGGVLRAPSPRTRWARVALRRGDALRPARARLGPPQHQATGPRSTCARDGTEDVTADCGCRSSEPVNKCAARAVCVVAHSLAHSSPIYLISLVVRSLAPSIPSRSRRFLHRLSVEPDQSGRLPNRLATGGHAHRGPRGQLKGANPRPSDDRGLKQTARMLPPSVATERNNSGGRRSGKWCWSVRSGTRVPTGCACIGRTVP